MSIDVDLEVLVSSSKDSVGPVVWLLQGLPHHIMADKDMGARGEIFADMYIPFGLYAYWSSSKITHGIPEACNECCRIRWRIG